MAEPTSMTGLRLSVRRTMPAATCRQHFDGGIRRPPRRDPELVQHTDRVQFAGRLHHPRQHQLVEASSGNAYSNPRIRYQTGRLQLPEQVDYQRHILTYILVTQPRWSAAQTGDLPLKLEELVLLSRRVQISCAKPAYEYALSRASSASRSAGHPEVSQPL